MLLNDAKNLAKMFNRIALKWTKFFDDFASVGVCALCLPSTYHCTARYEKMMNFVSITAVICTHYSMMGFDDVTNCSAMKAKHWILTKWSKNLAHLSAIWLTMVFALEHKKYVHIFVGGQCTNFLQNLK